MFSLQPPRHIPTLPFTSPFKFGPRRLLVDPDIPGPDRDSCVIPGCLSRDVRGSPKSLARLWLAQLAVAYDANQHGIQLDGKSLTYFAAKSSVDVPDGNFDGMTFEEVARKVLVKHAEIGIAVVGTLNPRVFQYLQNELGETNWDFLEKIARARGIVLGSDHLGNFLLIGDHLNPIVASLVEGENILSCQCVISIENLAALYEVANSGPASDPHNGTAASEQQESAPGTGVPTTNYKTPSVVPVHDDTELKEMAENEAVWSEGTAIQATITTPGWLMPGTTQLWTAGDNVFVNSPMAILDNAMTIRTATFTQDQRGTLTTLDLVIPWLLKDKIPAGANFPTSPAEPLPQPQPTAPQPPAPTQPPQTPALGPTFKWPYPRR
jgi:prophage tail gpP-like protein